MATSILDWVLYARLPTSLPSWCAGQIGERHVMRPQDLEKRETLQSPFPVLKAPAQLLGLQSTDTQ